MGSELGTRVARLLEADATIDAIAGVDLDPPRRRLLRAEFSRIDPRDATKVRSTVASFAPTAVVHLGVYEPFERSGPTASIERTALGTIAALGAAADAGALDHVVVRSGLEVYGRRRGGANRPDEQTAPDPTTPWGHSLLHAETVAAEAGRAADAPVTALRFAPIVGPHAPSPLARLLRLPAVPVALADPSFALVHHVDAADAIVAALRARFDGPVNVVADGTTSARRAACAGRRVPVAFVGPGWRLARTAAGFVGAPVPAHVFELLVRGRPADGDAAATRIGFTPTLDAATTIRQLYDWPDVTDLNLEAAA
jgi:UDP-glucose 4-epimerase